MKNDQIAGVITYILHILTEFYFDRLLKTQIFIRNRSTSYMYYGRPVIIRDSMVIIGYYNYL